MRSYGRGIAQKSEFTKKCSCDNPRWSCDHVEINGRTQEITYVLNCSSCKAYWGTKSPNARKYWDMDKIPTAWNGYKRSAEDKRTNRELFHEQDMKRLEYLLMVAESKEKMAEEARKEAEKARKATERFKEEMERWEAD